MCPSNLHVALVKDNFTPGIHVAPQNCNFKGCGAYTGEMSVDQIQDLGLGGTGQKLPKKPARAKPKKRKVEEHEKRKSVRLAGGPAPIERLQDDPRSYDDFFESRKRQKRAPRQEPWEPTDEQRDKLGEFCMEDVFWKDILG